MEPTENLQRYWRMFFDVGPVMPTPTDPLECVTKNLVLPSLHAPADVRSTNPSYPGIVPIWNRLRGVSGPVCKMGREQSDATEMNGPWVLPE